MTEVVAALLWKGGAFMICQRPTRKARGLLWEFAGGKVEPGETKEQALIRECGRSWAYRWPWVRNSHKSRTSTPISPFT